MVIGIDASRANRDRKTGTEWYSFYLIKNLAKIDSRNHYRLYLDREPSPELIAAVSGNPNFTFKVLHWPVKFFWTLGRLSWEMLIHRPRVLFVPAHALPLFFPKRTITTIHDIAFAREDRLYRFETAQTSWRISRKLVNYFVRIFTRGRYQANSVDYLDWSTRFALQKAKKIITVSDFTKQEISAVYPQADLQKIKVIHNGYNDEIYKLINDPEKISIVLSKYGLEKPYFLYVGRLEKKKSTPQLVEAVSIMRNYYPEIKEKLVLIGNAGFGYDEVKYVIEEFNLGSDVVTTGWVIEEDMPYIFAAATAFVFPSRHEGFGIPVLQAMACGTPTGVSDIPVLHEIAGDAVCYFDYQDKRAIAEALKELAINHDLREQLRLRGLTRVKDFSWRRCAEETLAELENL